MSAERHSLGGSFQDDPRSVQSIDLTEDASQPSESSCVSAPRTFVLARLIPAGPATALAMPPTVHRRAVS
jgi:hypothetical protein